MRVALIVPGFSASDSDWCIPALLTLVRRMSARADVHVFPLRYPHHRHPYRVSGVPVHPQGGADVRGPGRLALLQRALAAVVAEHRRRPFDVLHAFWADEPGFLAVTAGRLLGIPSVVSLAGGELASLPGIGYGGQRSRVNRLLIGISLRGAIRVTTGSTYLRDLALRSVPANRVRLAPLGVDTGLFQPDAPDRMPLDGHIRLLHAASLTLVKDQATLLRAFARVADAVPAAHLHIVGDGPLRDELEALSVALGVAGRTTFHGAVPHDRMPAYYRAADLCLLTSLHEAQGMVTLEAAACGRATLGTAVGLLPELAPWARSVPVGDAAALTSELIAVLRQPGATAALGEQALCDVRSRFTVEHAVATVMDLYDCLHRPRDSRP